MYEENTVTSPITTVAHVAITNVSICSLTETPGCAVCTAPGLIYTILEYVIIVVVSLPYSKIVNVY